MQCEEKQWALGAHGNANHVRQMWKGDYGSLQAHTGQARAVPIMFREGKGEVSGTPMW